jgi:hypothetical protein
MFSRKRKNKYKQNLKSTINQKKIQDQFKSKHYPIQMFSMIVIIGVEFHQENTQSCDRNIDEHCPILEV